MNRALYPYELLKLLRADWLSAPQIIELTGWTENTVREHLAEAVANGFVVSMPSPVRVSRTGYNPVVYRVHAQWRGE